MEGDKDTRTNQPTDPQAAQQAEPQAAQQAEPQAAQQAEPQAAQQADKKSVADELGEEMARWQTKIDEARVQMNLAAKDARDKLQPYVNSLERELDQADAKWQRFRDSSEGAWQQIHHGLQASFKVMQQAVEKAQQHYADDGDSKPASDK